MTSQIGCLSGGKNKYKYLSEKVKNLSKKNKYKQAFARKSEKFTYLVGE